MASSKRPDVAPVRDVPRDRISERLKSAHDLLASLGYASSYTTHRYPSGHVDGQINLDLPRGVTPTKVALDLERALGTTRMAGYWINAGVRFNMAAIEGVNYRRTGGAYDQATYPQKATPHNFAESLLILRNRIVSKSAGTLRRKPSRFYVRLYWTPDGSRPVVKRK